MYKLSIRYTDRKKGFIVLVQAFYRFRNLGNVKMLSTK
jgi:hypothetical protein